jgi:hypothetical protein
VYLECWPTVEQVIDGPSELVGQDGQRFALAVCLLEAGPIRLACRVVAEAEERRGRAGPLARRVADRRAGGALSFPSRVLGALDPAARGHQILAPWEAGAVMPLIQAHATEDLAKARARLEHVQRVAIMLLGHCDNGPRQGPQPLVILVDQGEVPLAAGWDRGSGTARGDPGAVGLVGERFADVGQGIRASGLLAGRQQRRPVAHEMPPTSEQVSRGSHGSGIDVGVGQHAPAQEHGHLVGIDWVVLRVATVERFPLERVPQDKRNPCLGPPVSQPGPGEETFNRDHPRFTRGGNRLEQRRRAGGQLARHHDLTVVVQNPDAHGASMPGDAAVKLVRLGVESPEVSSSSGLLFPLPAYHRGMLRRGPQ